MVNWSRCYCNCCCIDICEEKMNFEYEKKNTQKRNEIRLFPLQNRIDWLTENRDKVSEYTIAYIFSTAHNTLIKGKRFECFFFHFQFYLSVWRSVCCRFLRALSAASFGWVSVHCALVWHVSVFDVKPALILCWNLMIVTIQWKNNSSGNDNWINQIFRSSLWQFKTQQIRWKINLFETNVGCARVCVSVHSCSLDDKSSSIAWKKNTHSHSDISDVIFVVMFTFERLCFISNDTIVFLLSLPHYCIEM